MGCQFEILAKSARPATTLSTSWPNPGRLIRACDAHFIDKKERTNTMTTRRQIYKGFGICLGRFCFLFFSLEPRLLHALCAGEEVPDDKGESKIQELSEQVHLWLQVRSEPAEHQNAAE